MRLAWAIANPRYKLADAKRWNVSVNWPCSPYLLRVANAHYSRRAFHSQTSELRSRFFALGGRDKDLICHQRGHWVASA